jgi:phosphate acyltransferase
MLPVAIDANGGDRAPEAVVGGARRARDELGVDIVLVGTPDVAEVAGDLPLIEASEAIPMEADPGTSVRRMKDSTLVRAAEAVRDGRASAMVSAGNTGATMAAALLRMGRSKGVARPAIATPLPVPSGGHTVLLDAGANAECQPAWLVQFAQMGSSYARARYGVELPRVGLLSIGEEPGKGDGLRKDAHALLSEPGVLAAGGGEFVGNVEGRDLLTGELDVVVTDGFTGNVALKTLEGSMKALVSRLLEAFAASEATQKASEVLMPELAPLYASLDPENTGGAMLLGVDGVCIISHGSSGETAVVNAVRVAHEMVERDVVAALADAVS